MEGPGFATVNVVVAVSRALSKRALTKAKSVPSVSDIIRINNRKIVDISTGSQEILFTANTIFPFVLFPGTISMDRHKLTIIRRSFFRTANTISVQIGDILNVESNVGPFFGSIHIFSKYFTNDMKSISFLSRANVLKIQRLIQGYIVAHQEQIDCSTISRDQLVDFLNGLGQATATA